MALICARNISVSLDGFMAGPDQSVENPLGVRGTELHEWAFATRSFRTDHGLSIEGSSTGGDDDLIATAFDGIGATLMGRNMFGPVRGPWGDSDWTGWWGDDPVYHHPVVVLTHHERPSLPMLGGTTFHFETGGLEAGLARAIELADGRDVRVGGGASTLRQLLAAGLLDELTVAVAPVLLGSGERLFDGSLADVEGYTVGEVASSPAVAHFRLTRS
jgi:dihydrofolate reductase